MIIKGITIKKIGYDKSPYNILVETKYDVRIKIDTIDNKSYRVNTSATGPMTPEEAKLVAKALLIAADLAKQKAE